jgi:hypothetical protein
MLTGTLDTVDSRRVAVTMMSVEGVLGVAA